MIRVEAEALPDGLPGHARIVVTGAPEPAGIVAYQIRREGYTNGFLGRNGWQSMEERLAPIEVLPVPEAGSWALVLGPEVSRHMVAAPYQVRIDRIEGEHGIHWPDIEEYVPGTVYVPKGQPRQYDPERPDRVRLDEAAPPPPPPAEDALGGGHEDDTVIPEPGGETKKRPRWPWAVAAALVALGVLWAALDRDGMQQALGFGSLDTVVAGRTDLPGQGAPPPSLLPAPRGAPNPGLPPSPPRPVWPEGTDQLTRGQIVEAAPDVPGILRAALRRQQQGRYDDAVALLETAAERGEAEAFFVLGRMHDPAGFVPGRPFQQPNAYEAARYYREAAQRGLQAADPARVALHQYLEQQAAAGDRDARMALTEFWP